MILMTTSFNKWKIWSYHYLQDVQRPWLCQCCRNVWCWGFWWCSLNGHRQSHPHPLTTRLSPRSAQSWKRMGNCNAVGLFNAEPFSSLQGCSWLKWSPQTSASMRWPANVVVGGMKWTGNLCRCCKPFVMKCRGLSNSVPVSGGKITIRWFTQPEETAQHPD